MGKIMKQLPWGMAVKLTIFIILLKVPLPVPLSLGSLSSGVQYHSLHFPKYLLFTGIKLLPNPHPVRVR